VGGTERNGRVTRNRTTPDRPPGGRARARMRHPRTDRVRVPVASPRNSPEPLLPTLKRGLFLLEKGDSG
jgi:hypothetical protein